MAVINDETDNLLDGLPVKEQKASRRSSYINLTNTILGAGMLGIPYAFASAGTIFAFFMLSICCCAAGFGLSLLATAANECPVGYSSYFAVAQITYPKARILIDGAIAIKCFGVAVSYLIVVGGVMPDSVRELVHDLPHDSVFLNRHFWITVAMVVIIPISFLKNIDALRFTSIVALFSVFYLIFIILYYFFSPNYPVAPSSELNLFPHDIGIIGAIPIFVFAFTCHQNLFSVYNELPRAAGTRMNQVVAGAVSSCWLAYAFIGLFAYLTFGRGVSSNIINDYSISVLVTIGRITLAANVTLSYPLQCHPARNSIDKIIFGAKERTPARYVGVTLGILILSYVIAWYVKSLGVVFSLIGATGSTTICYILPGSFYVKVAEKDGWTIKRILAFAMAITGVVIMVVAVTYIILSEVDLVPKS